MNCLHIAEPAPSRANPKWWPKTRCFAHSAINHSSGIYAELQALLIAIYINNQTGSRKTPVKCGLH